MTDDEGALPPIGSPATRALASVGITRLEQLQQHRAEDLLALHGVGPKAISRLGSALADHGLSLLAESPPRTLSADVQDYIDALDAAHRRLFDRLHQLIIDELPDAQVVISYQIPLYRAGRRHVGLNARRPEGVTLTTTSPDHIDAFRRRHPQFKTGKASIQFQLNDELPEDGIRDVIRRAIKS
ncbi:MAG TPA: DUF1801 domain-containing protein [Acidimicrobiales bacterium]|nr:DUF1801 domain-containing protein [Acidimicrobiales bacterium]